MGKGPEILDATQFFSGNQGGEAIGLRTKEIGKPFNVLNVFFRNVSVDEFAAAGAKRISVGGALNWIAVSPLLKAGKEMLEQGTFNWTSEMAQSAEVRDLLS